MALFESNDLTVTTTQVLTPRVTYQVSNIASVGLVDNKTEVVLAAIGTIGGLGFCYFSNIEGEADEGTAFLVIVAIALFLAFMTAIRYRVTIRTSAGDELMILETPKSAKAERAINAIREAMDAREASGQPNSASQAAQMGFDRWAERDRAQPEKEAPEKKEVKSGRLIGRKKPAKAEADESNESATIAGQRFCYSCGQTLPADAGFCMRCGKEQPSL